MTPYQYKLILRLLSLILLTCTGNINPKSVHALINETEEEINKITS